MEIGQRKQNHANLGILPKRSTMMDPAQDGCLNLKKYLWIKDMNRKCVVILFDRGMLEQREILHGYTVACVQFNAMHTFHC